MASDIKTAKLVLSQSHCRPGVMRSASRKTMSVLGKVTIWFNNLRCRSSKRRFLPENVLMLLPHCLQHSDCKEPVKEDIRNCKGCGRCKMKDLRALAEEYGMPVSVASGGREAQARARDPRVRIILAVACARELAEGIRATFPKKVFSVPNSWPNGPCKNTDVDVAMVREAIERLVEPSPTAAPEDTRTPTPRM